VNGVYKGTEARCNNPPFQVRIVDELVKEVAKFLELAHCDPR
jgi:hypothetical protein